MYTNIKYATTLDDVHLHVILSYIIIHVVKLTMNLHVVVVHVYMYMYVHIIL